MTDAEYQRILAVARALAARWMKTILEQSNVDVLVSGMSYSGNAGAAGVPALTIPAGLDPKGRPQGVILSGPYLSEPRLFAVGYALEQALKGRVEPDLDATIRQIEAVTGQTDVIVRATVIRASIHSWLIPNLPTKTTTTSAEANLARSIDPGAR